MAAVHLGVLSLPHHYLACQRPPRYRRVRRTVRIQRDTSERNDPARDAPTTVEVGNAVRAPTTRSEEHTSELQSLMRISYAVFCLKKKKQESNKQEIARKLKHST